jgi:inosose dehydratase
VEGSEINDNDAARPLGAGAEAAAAARPLGAGAEAAAAARPVGAGAQAGRGAPARRLAGAPISWGVCEVPGWGLQLPPARVLDEMVELGLDAIELGPIGWLPADPDALARVLQHHGLRLVGGFVPLVLHEPEFEPARAQTEKIARLLAAVDADVFVAAIVQDLDWSAPSPFDDAQWRRTADRLARVEELVARRGLTLALHPHAGTLLENAEQVERALAATTTCFCLDTGHLTIGGIDPTSFVRDHGERIVHVHLKDVDKTLATQVRERSQTLMQATQQGLFRPLGQGHANIEEVVRLLDRHGYERWLVLEQDTAITGKEPPVGSGPIVDVKASIDFLNTLARQEEESVA